MEGILIQKQGEFPFATFLPKEVKGWLYSTPVSKKMYSEPMREEFSMTVNGEVARKWRDRIDEPFKYETFLGYLHIELASIIIPAREIKKLLEKESLLSDEKAEEFIEIIRSAVRSYRCLVENNLKNEPVIESPHPLMAFFTLRDNVDILETIRYSTDRLFPDEKDELRRFIEQYWEELLTVKLVRRFKVFRTEKR
jgi:hypothetical protein